jgi:hypothetical protein
MRICCLRSGISEEQPPSNELPGKPVREVSEGGQADFHFRAGTPAKVAKVAKDARALAGLATLAATQARESHPAIPRRTIPSALRFGLWRPVPPTSPKGAGARPLRTARDLLASGAIWRWRSDGPRATCSACTRRQRSRTRATRYDETGLIWLLQGREVIALTAETAAIRGSSGSLTIYPKSNRPALGPFGDSLEDFQ